MPDGGITDKTHIKIFILFLLNEIDYPLDYPTVIEMMTESGYVGTFDFAETFGELCDRGHITEQEVSGIKIYSVSETGRLIAEEMQGHLMQSIRDKSRRIALRYLSLAERDAKISTSVENRALNRYVAICEIRDKRGVMFHTEAAASTKAEAEKICKHFERDPLAVFRGTMAVLTGEIDDYLKHPN